MKTKERILEMSVQLFNENGTSAISTNHIAEACGISPGNLYYHFRNKQDIIRAILERMFDRWGSVWTLPEGPVTARAAFQAIVEDNVSLLWEYRFFYWELVPLLRQDEALQKRYRENVRRRLEEQETYFMHLVEAGVLRRPGSRELRDVLTACWVLANNWTTHLEAVGQCAGPQELEQLVRILLKMVAPYMMDSEKREMGSDEQA